MKTTVNVSLSGRAFIVEDDAYVMLNNYLDDIKSRLSSAENEILSDVESRIAEILSSKIGNVTQVVNVNLVQTVISTIGAPHYFGEKNSSQEKKCYDTPPPRRHFTPTQHRLMRDGQRRVFGGVCAGIASYFGLDITLIRVIAIILFFCAGFGLVPYLILWIVIPKAITAEEMEMVTNGYENR